MSRLPQPQILQILCLSSGQIDYSVSLQGKYRLTLCSVIFPETTDFTGMFAAFRCPQFELPLGDTPNHIFAYGGVLPRIFSRPSFIANITGGKLTFSFVDPMTNEYLLAVGANATFHFCLFTFMVEQLD
jgi:hypothetical protein